jgi:FkbM family methyltransferase
MAAKPKSPYPTILRRILIKILPADIYKIYLCRHEQGSLRIWNALASRLTAQDTILDIGAFHGEYAVFARSVNRQVAIYAFEPNPLSAQTCRQKCQGLNIHLEECAVARENGLVSFRLQSAMSRMEQNKSPIEGEKIQVHTICLDDWVDENMSIALVKIDVEGAEADVLLGGKSTLRKHFPIILCEVLSNEAGKRVMSALPAEYYYYHIDENRGLSPCPVVAREQWRNKNWLFVHSSQIDLINPLRILWD